MIKRYNCLSKTDTGEMKTKKTTKMLRVSFKSWWACSGLVKTADPRVCTIPETRRHDATAACTIQNSKEAYFQLGTCICFPPTPFQQTQHFSPKHGTGWRSAHVTCMSVHSLPQKGVPTGLALCTILASFISVSANEAVATLLQKK